MKGGSGVGGVQDGGRGTIPDTVRPEVMVLIANSNTGRGFKARWDIFKRQVIRYVVYGMGMAMDPELVNLNLDEHRIPGEKENFPQASLTVLVRRSKQYLL